MRPPQLLVLDTHALCLSGQLNSLLNCLLLTRFSFPLLSPLNDVFLLSCKVNCDRFKDGRSINRRSRKSKRGLCPVRYSSAPLLHLYCCFFTSHHLYSSVKCFCCHQAFPNYNPGIVYLARQAIRLQIVGFARLLYVGLVITFFSDVLQLFLLFSLLSFPLHREEQAEWPSTSDVNTENGGSVRL